jgi:hypothetical protein
MQWRRRYHALIARSVPTSRSEEGQNRRPIRKPVNTISPRREQSLIASATSEGFDVRVSGKSRDRRLIAWGATSMPGQLLGRFALCGRGPQHRPARPFASLDSCSSASTAKDAKRRTSNKRVPCPLPSGANLGANFSRRDRPLTCASANRIAKRGACALGDQGRCPRTADGLAVVLASLPKGAFYRGLV